MFVFPLDPAELFAERARQMVAWGIPRRTVDGVRSRVDNCWSEGPGGWAHEWMRPARDAEARGRWLLAAACYGAAKFPTACTPLRERAFAKQLECYLNASRGFSGFFDRRVLEIGYRGGTTRVTVHVLARDRPSRDAPQPLLCLTGGVDTFKIELHRLAAMLARVCGVTVAAIDMPGTGESEIALAPDGDAIYEGVLDRLGDELSTGLPRGAFGISFGGRFAAKLALREAVDAAVDLGGPVGATALDGSFLARLPNGMTGIVANALRLEAMPTPAEAETLLAAFSLREQSLLDRRGAPLLVVNGSDDPYLPRSESLVFDGRPDCEVWLVRGGDHCAANRFARVALAVAGWLRARLHGDTRANRWLATATRALLPRLERPTRSAQGVRGEPRGP